MKSRYTWTRMPLIGVLGLSLALGGCASSGDSTAYQDTSSSSSSGSSPSWSDQDLAVQKVRQSSAGAAGKSDEDLLNVMGVMCERLDAGESAYDVMDMIVGVFPNADRTLIAATLASAITYICPRHSGALD